MTYLLALLITLTLNATPKKPTPTQGDKLDHGVTV
jgi:hypothetical protein